MAKLDIDFILIDGSVVMNGFRALPSGAKLEGFKNNPVLLFMHNRAEGGLIPATNEIVLPIGKWYDIRVEDNKLKAKPEFDDDDPFAVKIEGKVKKGYLNGASIWIDPITVSDDEALALAGQRGPTVTEWGVLEASIVDIPNCKNALAIRNSAGKKITLSSNTGDDIEIINYLKTLLPTDKNNTMDRKLLCAQLGLPENATDTEISAKLSAIKSGSETGSQLVEENKKLKADVLKLTGDADQQKRDALINDAIKEGKIVAGDKEKYEKLAAADFDTTKSLIEGMKSYESLEQKLSVGANETDKVELEGLMKLSGRELYLQGKLDRLKVLSEPHFKLKYKEYFGSEYKA